MVCSICKCAGHTKTTCLQNPLSKKALEISKQKQMDVIRASATKMPNTAILTHPLCSGWKGTASIKDVVNQVPIKITEKKEKKVEFRPTPTPQFDNFSLPRKSFHPTFGYADDYRFGTKEYEEGIRNGEIVASNDAILFPPPLFDEWGTMEEKFNTPLVLLNQDGMCEMVEEGTYEPDLTLLNQDGMCEMVETNYGYTLVAKEQPKIGTFPNPKVPEYKVHRNAKRSGDGRENPLLLAMLSKREDVCGSLYGGLDGEADFSKITSSTKKVYWDSMGGGRYDYDKKSKYQDTTDPWRL